MFRKHLIPVSIFGILFLGTILFSNCHHRPYGFFHGSHQKKADWITKRIAKELKLNDQQKAKLDQIKNEVLAKHGDFKEIHNGMYEAFLTEVKSESANQDKLNQLFLDREAKMKEMRSFMIEKFAEFHEILTPGQRAKLAEKMEKFHEDHHQE